MTQQKTNKKESIFVLDVIMCICLRGKKSIIYIVFGLLFYTVGLHWRERIMIPDYLWIIFFQLAGMESGYACFCGNDIDYHRHGDAPSTECNHVCFGDHTQPCGGDGRVIVFDSTFFRVLLSVQRKVKDADDRLILTNLVKTLSFTLFLSLSSKSWSCHFSLIAKVGTCGGNYSSPSAVIYSPDFPDKYKPGRVCYWTIQVQLML